MEGKLLKAVIEYNGMGFSVIPCKKNKKPFIKWEKYQTERASLEQIRAWWEKWPAANPGIITGAVSGVDVVDADSETGKATIEEFLPDSLLIPTVKTPKGYHFYFKHSPGLQNGTRIISDCDLRTTGGYVLTPPGSNEGGAYSWADGLKITDLALPEMPDMLFDVLKNGGRCTGASSSERIYKNDSIPLDKNSLSREGDNIAKKPGDNTRQHLTTNDNIGFDKGCRDNTLFHLANHLVKSGMPTVTIEIYLRFFASHCKPPFPEKEISLKIQSALKRFESRDRNLTKEIRDLIVTTSGNITTTFIQQMTTLTTREDKKKSCVILGRLEKEGLIEKTGRIAGEYRRIESDCKPMDWVNAPTEFIDIWLPYGLDRIAGVQPGNVLVFAGEKDSGKTAALMNIAKENRHDFNIYYFSSEMAEREFKMRASKFDITPDQWGIKVYERASNFQDVIKPGEGNLNIIDFLEIYDNFYRIGANIAKIHEKLKGAVAIIAIQKSPGQDFGRGGAFSLEKARLYISLFQGKAKCISCKNFREDSPAGNPRGKEYHFKLVDGCKFIRTGDWHKPVEG